MRILKFFLRLIIATFLFALFMICTQDFHIFPGLYSSKIFGYKNVPSEGIKEIYTAASDGYPVAIWRMKAEVNPRKQVALLFHGNAENLSTFLQYQKWLKSMGITSYSVEYRGYSGRNSGWPSESGFYADSEAGYQLLLKEEKITNKEVIVLGSSIGTGVATYIAQKFDTGTLVMLSPYTSLKALVSDMPLTGYLSYFLKYEFPNDERISKLTSTCVVDSHGKNDTIIPFGHSEKLKAIYKGKSTYTQIVSESAGHNDIMSLTHKEVEAALLKCLD